MVDADFAILKARCSAKFAHSFQVHQDIFIYLLIFSFDHDKGCS